MLKASPDPINTENTAGENVIGLFHCRLKIIAGGQKVHGQSGSKDWVAFFLRQIFNGLLTVNGSRFHKFRKRIFLRSENLLCAEYLFFLGFATISSSRQTFPIR